MTHNAFKIILIGNSSVGKTSLVNRYTNKTVSINTDPTIGASFVSAIVKNNNDNIRLNIWDTAGQERYRSLMEMYYRNTDLCIIVFDMNNYNIDDIKYWICNLLERSPYENPKFILVGNKLDLITKNVADKIDKDMNDIIEKYNTILFKTSAKNDENVDELFKYIANILANMPKEQINSKNEHINLNHNNTWGSYMRCNII